MLQRAHLIALGLSAFLTAGVLTSHASAQTSGVILVSTMPDRSPCLRPAFLTVRTNGQVFQIVQKSIDLHGAAKTTGGDVHAVTLSPGDYYIEFALFGSYSRTRNNILKEFRVNAGGVTYLGDAAVQGCREGTLTVTNKWNQTRAQFMKAHPGLDYKNVKIDLMKTGTMTFTSR